MRNVWTVKEYSDSEIIECLRERKSYVVRYLTDRYRIPGITNVSQDNKSNFIKDMMAEQMSWHSFLRNLTITQVVKFDFRLKLYYKNGTESEHLNTVYLDPDLAEEMRNKNLPK